MSTYYYDLSEPWADIEVESSPEHYRITLWDGQSFRAGTLSVRPDDGLEAIRHFFGDVPVCQIYFDGQDRALRKLRRSRTTTLLSEYGELTNVTTIEEQCRRPHGAKLEMVSDGPA